MGIQSWLGTGSPIDPISRAYDTVRRINEKPVVLKLVRGDTALPDQTCRVELLNETNEKVSDGAGVSGKQVAILFGVRDHPDIPDFDIIRGDMFKLQDKKFRTVAVTVYPGEIQARLEVMS